jgi:chromatin remodeling complex protein RSC6
MIQIYYKSNNTFAVCTSASRANREHFATLENELHFVTKYDTKTQRAKTTQRTAIAYDDIVDVVKSVIAVLESTAKAKQSDTESDTEAKAEAEAKARAEAEARAEARKEIFREAQKKSVESHYKYKALREEAKARAEAEAKAE